MSKKWMAGSVALFLPLVACSSPEEDIEALGEEYEIRFAVSENANEHEEDLETLDLSEVELLFATLRESMDEGTREPDDYNATIEPALTEPISEELVVGSHTASSGIYHEYGDEFPYFSRSVTFRFSLESEEEHPTPATMEIRDIESMINGEIAALEWQEISVAENFNDETGNLEFAAFGEWSARFIYEDLIIGVNESDIWDLVLDASELLP